VGQVIRLPVRPPAYPDRSAELDPAECVLLIAVRWWVADHRVGVEPLPRLCQALDIAGAHDAAFSVDRLMAVVARSVRQSIVIQCPRGPRMSDDEKSLLHAASLAQAGDAQCAEKALHTVLLSAQGAEFALGPLKGIGELFAAARLLFRRRSPPLTGDVISGIVEPWSPPESSGTAH
jgi:hypothetical protein